MLGRWMRLIRRQMEVQFQVRLFNWFSLALLITQPVIFSGVGMVLAHVAGRQAPDMIYTVIGGGVMGMWSRLLFSSTFDIRSDRRDGTLELIVGSPTSLGTVEAIRTLTNVCMGLVSMTVAFCAAALVFGYSLSMVNVFGVVVSLLLVMVGMWSIGVFLANFLVWSRLAGSLVDFLELPVAVLCGFMYPITILPGWLQPVSTVIPFRWALQALNACLLGSQDYAWLAEKWGLALGIAVLYWGATRWLEGRVHDRIRVSGELNSI